MKLGRAMYHLVHGGEGGMDEQPLLLTPGGSSFHSLSNFEYFKVVEPIVGSHPSSNLTKK
jgi:hypothetical protein